MIKKMIILRGLPGSGKSTRARAQSGKVDGSVVCSNDDYFKRGGRYKFDRNRLHLAVSDCERKAEAACSEGAPLVIIDNTNIKRKSFQAYVEMGEKYGYDVEVLIVGSLAKGVFERYHKRNTHNTPLYIIKDMAAKWER